MPGPRRFSRIGSNLFAMLFVAMVYYAVHLDIYSEVDLNEFENEYLRRLHGTGDDALLSSGGHQRSFKIFGGMEQLKTEEATVSFIIVICLVVFLENFFHEVHSLTHDTPLLTWFLQLKRN